MFGVQLSAPSDLHVSMDLRRNTGEAQHREQQGDLTEQNSGILQHKSRANLTQQYFSAMLNES